jgi:hypothetical protein
MVRRTRLASFAGQTRCVLQGLWHLMIRQGIDEVVQVRFVIELYMKLGDDAL